MVVPTYQRPDLLERCLDALVGQDFNPAGFEIVVVDDAASEVTRKQVEEWSRKMETYLLWPKPRKQAQIPITNPAENDSPDGIPGELVRVPASPVIRYIPNRGVHGPAAARNAGWQAAQANIIAFTDDDCLPSPGWLSAGVAAIQAGADGASGKVRMPSPLFRPTTSETRPDWRDRSSSRPTAFTGEKC